MVEITFYVLLLIVSLAAVALNIFSLPGNWIVFAAAAGWSASHGWSKPSLWLLAFMLLMLLAAEGIEFLASMVGARKFGASKAASWIAVFGALAGAVVGLPVPYIGSLLGAIAGAFFAAWIVELIHKQPMHLALRAAMGAALGRTVAIFAKIGCGLVVWLCLAIGGFP